MEIGLSPKHILGILACFSRSNETNACHREGTYAGRQRSRQGYMHLDSLRCSGFGFTSCFLPKHRAIRVWSKFVTCSTIKIRSPIQGHIVFLLKKTGESKMRRNRGNWGKWGETGGNGGGGVGCLWAVGYGA